MADVLVDDEQVTISPVSPGESRGAARRREPARASILSARVVPDGIGDPDHVLRRLQGDASPSR